ncbi:MAG: DUF1007 family protein [Rhizobiales bacterium]|nr:DUF1007 family protein [Hyphomicrobiales bacterium]
MDKGGFHRDHCGAAVSPALAHPHVWVEMRSDVVFDDAGTISGVNIEWTFDDAYAQMALDGLDANKDGFYSEPEIAPLTKENMKSLKDYGYFTVMRLNGNLLETGEAKEAGQLYANDKLKLHFHVPLKQPLDPRSGEFIVKVYDPDFFIALDYAKDEPVTVIGQMPKGCAMEVKPVPTDEELEQTREMLSAKGKDWKPENNEDFGAMFAQPVIVSCKS